MTKKITLYQALKQSGLFSTKEQIISVANAGQITVDGVVTKALQFQFAPTKRTVCVNGKEISFQTKRYFVLNKPAGFSCQKNDRDPYVVKILDLPAEVKNSLFPVGRLDVGTTGLLIITNDGAFSAALLEPERNVSKTYRVSLKQKITEKQLEALQKGVVILIENVKYQTLPAVVEKLDDRTLAISIVEGKNRQVRKMIEAVGNDVVALSRIAIGTLQLGKLEEGHWREYSEELIKKMLIK
ncbi:rRNA pseudouridine synthase [Candidatus Woesearchaeota archaeon]|nr:rRNA pseudouridine synthase [Candidatus Woesearchaeota archaeon]